MFSMERHICLTLRIARLSTHPVTRYIFFFFFHATLLIHHARAKILRGGGIFCYFCDFQGKYERSQVCIMNCDIFVCLHMQTDCLKISCFGARSWFVKAKHVFL